MAEEAHIHVHTHVLYPVTQSGGMAEEVGAAMGSRQMDGTEACGSPGEVGNRPAYGHKYHMHLNSIVKGKDEMLYDRLYPEYELGKAMVHMNVVLGAHDQLRQRTAWALSQV